MGFFDPVWAAVDSTIAGAGAAVAGGITAAGEGISSAGRSAGDAISSSANGYADYVHNGANYVRDATGAEGVRKGTGANPLGLSSDKASARTYGAAKNYAGMGGTAGAKAAGEAQRKQIMDKAGAAKGKGAASGTAKKSAQANTGAKRAGPAAAGGAAKPKPAGAPGKLSPAQKAAVEGKSAGGAQKKVGGSVTGTSAGISPARKIAMQKAQEKKKAAAKK